MPKLSSKRQITLPQAFCKELEISPGDEVEIFVYQGRITLVKKEAGAAMGLLDGLTGEPVDDDASRDDAIEQRRKRVFE